MTRTKQPNSSMCFICGLQNPVGLHLHFYETEPGMIESRYSAPAHFQGYPGILHGGIVGAILDEASGRAHMGSDLAAPRFMFTAKLEIKYRANVPIARPLRIVGRAGRSRGKSAQAWAGIFLAEGDELLAEANALLVDAPPDQVGRAQLESLGWRVYPE